MKQIDSHLYRGTGGVHITITRVFLKILEKQNLITPLSSPQYAESLSTVPVCYT